MATIKAQARYFGMIAETLSRQDETIELDLRDGNLDLRSFFNNRFPQLEGMSYKIAVDLEFREQINSNDDIQEIALLPPFAGG